MHWNHKYVEYKRGMGRKYGRASIGMLQDLERFFEQQPHIRLDEMLSKAAVDSFVAKRPKESLNVNFPQTGNSSSKYYCF